MPGDSTAVAYAILGLALCAAGAVVALTRGRSSRSFYASQVYHLTVKSHRRFALLSAGFGAGFVLALRWPVIEIPLLAVYVLALILYASSFARGFTGEDE